MSITRQHLDRHHSLGTLPNVPQGSSPPDCHMYISGSQHHDAFLVDEDLAHRAIGGEEGLEGGISLKFGAIKGGNAPLGSHQQVIREAEAEQRDIHSRFQSKEAPANYQTS